MALDQVILGLDIISVILFLATLVFMVKNREFERLEVENSLNALIFGVFFIFLVMVINTIIFLNKSYSNVFASFGDISRYLNYLEITSELGLIPLFAVSFLVGIILARDYLSGFPIKQEEEEQVKIIK